MIYSNTETFSIIDSDKKMISYKIDIFRDTITKISDQNNLRLSLCDVERSTRSGILKDYQKIDFTIYIDNNKYYIKFIIMNIEQEPIEIDKNFDTIIVPLYLSLHVHRKDICVLTKVIISFSSKVEFIFALPSSSFNIKFPTIKVKTCESFIIEPNYMTYPFYIENDSYLLTKKNDTMISNIEGYLIFNIINCI